MTRLSILLAALLSLAGCTSLSYLSSVPPKQSDTDCLVLIPTATVNPNGVSFGRQYSVNLSEQTVGYEISTAPKSYLRVVVTKPGLSLNKLHSYVRKELNLRGPDTDDPINFPLPYEAGKVLVYPITLTLIMRSVPGGYTAGVIFEKTTGERETELLELVRSNPKNAAWFAE